MEVVGGDDELVRGEMRVYIPGCALIRQGQSENGAESSEKALSH